MPKKIQLKRLLLCLPLLLLPFLGEAQFYYGLHQTYGKNRVQFNEFDWKYYRYEAYDVYFYKNGKPIAQKASLMAERNLKRMQSMLDQVLDQRIRIMVFNSLTDLKQSNLNPSDDESYNTGGVTRTAGTRMFVYFNGDYAHLEQQIREGLAYLMLSNMLYGGFTSALKNSTLLNLPEWFTEGLISYVSTPWNPAIDERVLDGFTAKTYKRINSLAGEEAKYCGHSWWQYIAETYGNGVIKNILFMTVLNRSVAHGVQPVLGISLDELNKNWTKYYRDKFQNTLHAESLEGKEILKSKKEEKILNPKISNNGRYMVYATNEQGQYKTYLYNFAKKKKKRILKRGQRIAQNNDYSFPLIAWHPNNRIVAIITEEKGFIWLYFYDVKKKKLEKRSLFGFEKITSFSYSPDGKEFVMSAIKGGKSDIFVYTILSKSIDQITNDDFTDHAPSFINGNKQIVFSSNRIDDSLRVKQQAWHFKPTTDLFVYHRFRKDNQVLWRLTNTPAESEVEPQFYEPGYVAFLSNPDNRQQRFFIGIDSTIAYVDTATHYSYNFTRYSANQYSRNVVAQDFSPTGEKTINLFFKDKRYRIYEATYLPAEELNLHSNSGLTKRQKQANKTRNQTYEDIIVAESDSSVKQVQGEIDIDNYVFHPDLVRPETQQQKGRQEITPLVSTTTQQAEVFEKPDTEEHDFPPARNYFITLLRDNFTVQMDFAFDNPQYQIYTGTPTNSLLNAGFNVMFKVGAVDLFNNYRLVGGFRTDFQPVAGLSLSPNSEIMLGLINNKKRINKALTFYRRSQFDQGISLYRLISTEAHFKVTWPFNEVQAVKASVGFRHQNGIYLSDGRTPLGTPNDITDYGIVKAAFVHDNTRKLGVNLYKGTRYKVFTEYYRNFSIKNSGMHTLGIDFRNYQQIHRSLIFATRFAAGTSFGQEKLLHFLGGVDNAVNTTLNTETPVSQTENYAFQTVVTNMRGFRQNVRNGNSFAVVNAELRFPIFNYLVNRPIRSDFINSFQIIGFGDVGTAWTGPSPWSDENDFNNKEINTPNLEISINRQTNPLVGGYGIGLRTRVLGYFVRADWAWGVENGLVLPNIFYFSLSTDF